MAHFPSLLFRDWLNMLSPPIVPPSQQPVEQSLDSSASLSVQGRNAINAIHKKGKLQQKESVTQRHLCCHTDHTGVPIRAEVTSALLFVKSFTKQVIQRWTVSVLLKAQPRVACSWCLHKPPPNFQLYHFPLCDHLWVLIATSTVPAQPYMLLLWREIQQGMIFEALRTVTAKHQQLVS